MKNRLSSFVKTFAGGDSCTLFAVVVVLFSVVILWKVINVVYAQLMDLESLQGLTALNR